MALGHAALSIVAGTRLSAVDTVNIFVETAAEHRALDSCNQRMPVCCDRLGVPFEGGAELSHVSKTGRDS